MPMDPRKHVLQNIVGVPLIVHPFGNKSMKAIMQELPEFFCRLRQDGRSIVSIPYWSRLDAASGWFMSTGLLRHAAAGLTQLPCHL